MQHATDTLDGSRVPEPVLHGETEPTYPGSFPKVGLLGCAQEMDVATIKRLKSWTIALRQMFRSKARQKEEDDTVIMRSA